MKTITSQKVLEFCSTHDWHKRKIKLLQKHMNYLEKVCDLMESDTHQAMNDAALKIDFDIRIAKGATIVPELISCYLTSLRSRVKS